MSPHEAMARTVRYTGPGRRAGASPGPGPDPALLAPPSTRSASHDSGRDDDRHGDYDRPDHDAERRVLVFLHLLLQREGEDPRQDREEGAQKHHSQDREHDRRPVSYTHLRAHETD